MLWNNQNDHINSALTPLFSELGYMSFYSGPIPQNCGPLTAQNVQLAQWPACHTNSTVGLQYDLMFPNNPAANTMQAMAAGTVSFCRMYDIGDEVAFDGMVGTIWYANTAYAVGTVVTNTAGGWYICQTAGITSSGSAPTGTGTGITDGTVVWDYVAPGTNPPTCTLSIISLVQNLPVVINSATIQLLTASPNAPINVPVW